MGTSEEESMGKKIQRTKVIILSRNLHRTNRLSKAQGKVQNYFKHGKIWENIALVVPKSVPSNSMGY